MRMLTKKITQPITEKIKEEMSPHTETNRAKITTKTKNQVRLLQM